MRRSALSIDELYRQSRNAAAWGVAVGLGLGIAKLAGGLLGNSMALLSDSVHSLGDAFVSAVVLVALRWSQTPPDREHPYGHTRGEAVAGSNVALLLVCSAVAIIWEAVVTWNAESPEPANFALWIAAASVVVKEVLYRHQNRVAGKTGSSAIRATAWDHRMDAISSLAVLVALALQKWGGPRFHPADHIAAILVALTIFWSGARLFWQSFQELMDRQAEPEFVDRVRQDALTVKGVRNVEKLRVRKTGLEYLVDIHVEVDPEMTVREGHAIAHAVKDHLMRKVSQVKDVLVHIEPAGERGEHGSQGDGQGARGEQHRK
jgi:cation diffusion facilitator family transporter